jgi:hypothetical protein
VTRPSDAVLTWLRERIDARGLKTSKVAKAIGLKTPEFRKLLAGETPMLLDDFVRLGDVLGLDANDVAGLPAADLATTFTPTEVPEPERTPCQAELLFKLGFDMQIDIHVRFIESELGDWGGPDSARASFVGKDMPIQLMAQYHRYMEPQLDDAGLHVTLSFDTLYRCTFPWSSIRAVTFVPFTPPPVAPPPAKVKPSEPAPARPTLRLVK